jgi:hypothetical protein
MEHRTVTEEEEEDKVTYTTTPYFGWPLMGRKEAEWPRDFELKRIPLEDLKE